MQLRYAGNHRPRVVDEFVLLEHCLCPAREVTLAPAGVMDSIAEDVLKWLTWETSERALPTLPNTRSKANQLFFQRQAQMSGEAANLINRISRRLHDLVAFSVVLHPYGEYRLDLGATAITGHVAVFQRRGMDKAFVVRLRSRLRRRLPDVVSAARWLYAQRESGFSRVELADFWYDADARKNSTFDEGRVEHWLRSAAASWNMGHIYPNPGPQCQRCSQPCIA